MENQKIKICHVVSVDITLKFLLLGQLNFLQKEGYDVYAVCSPGKWVKEIKQQGIRIKTIEIKRKISPFFDLVTLWKLFFYFRKEKFNIVHTHTPKPGLLGQLAAKLAGVPIIINTVHGLYFQKDSSFIKRMFFIFMEKVGAKCSTLIFSQNKEDIQTMVNEKISSEEKIKYLGNGVDIDKFNSLKFSEEFIADKKIKLGIEDNLKIVGTIGRLVKEKGYLELFSAFKIVLEKFPKTLLLIVGPEEPEKKDALKTSVVKNYGIENNVLFLVERSDVDEIYPLMDVFVLASHREGFPRTIIEAMASTKPVIATNIRGCRDAVENGVTGKLVPVDDSVKLAEEIIYFLNNPDVAKQMGGNGRKKAEKEFDERLVFDRIKKEYKKLIDKKC